MEVLVKRHSPGQGNKLIISNEYEYITKGKRQHTPYSATAVIKVRDAEQFGLEFRVNQTYMDLPSDDTSNRGYDGGTNAQYHLFFAVYLHGKKQFTKELKKNSMPDYIQTNILNVNLSKRGSCAYGDNFVQPEQGEKMPDVQVQVYRIMRKGRGKKNIKPENPGKSNDRGQRANTVGNRFQNSTANTGAGISKNSGKGGPVCTIYVDERDDPYAIYRFQYYAKGDGGRGRVRLLPKERVLLPRSRAFVDLTEEISQSEPVFIDLTDPGLDNGG